MTRLDKYLDDTNAVTYGDSAKIRELVKEACAAAVAQEGRGRDDEFVDKWLDEDVGE